MLGMLFQRAQATVDRAIEGVINRAIVAVPLLIAAGFATAALAIRLNRELGPETGSLVLAGAFAALGLVTAFAVRARSERLPENSVAAEETPASEAEAGVTAAADFSSADRELMMAALTSAAPIAVPALLRTLGRNLPLVAAVVAAVFIIARDDRGGGALEPGE